MRISRRFSVLSAAVAAILIAGSAPVIAQDPGAKPEEKPSATSTKRSYDPARRVPDYFGQLGLTPEQKESIYKIRGKYQDQLNDLKKQMSELQGKTVGECETVLTDTQKQLLEQRRRSAATAKKADGTDKGAKPPAEVVKAQPKPAN